MTQSQGNQRQAAIAFILVTIFIDILGIGIVVPVLPQLVKELLSDGSQTVIAATEGASNAAEVVADSAASSEPSSDDAEFSRAGRYVGMIGASYALMQFLFAPVLGALSDRFGRRPIILISLFGLGIDFLIQ